MTDFSKDIWIDLVYSSIPLAFASLMLGAVSMKACSKFFTKYAAILPWILGVIALWCMQIVSDLSHNLKMTAEKISEQDHILIAKHSLRVLTLEEQSQLNFLKVKARKDWNNCHHIAGLHLFHKPINPNLNQMNESFVKGTLPKEQQVFIQELIDATRSSWEKESQRIDPADRLP